MKAQILLKFNISYPVYEFPSQKRVGIGRLNVGFRPRLPMQYAQILFKQGERLSVLLSSYVKSTHSSLWFIYMPKTEGQSLPN